MPLGYITLLSEKGGRCDENETQTPAFFFFFVIVHGRHRTLFLFLFWDFMNECCSRVIHVCYDRVCTIINSHAKTL